jgi:hypothetical protein
MKTSLEWLKQKANLAIANALPQHELDMFPAELNKLAWKDKPAAYREYIKVNKLFGFEPPLD